MTSQNDELSALRQELKAGLDSLNKRLDGMDARFDGMDARFDGMDVRFDALNRGPVFVARKVLAPSEVQELRTILEGRETDRARKAG